MLRKGNAGNGAETVDKGYSGSATAAGDATDVTDTTDAADPTVFDAGATVSTNDKAVDGVEVHASATHQGIPPSEFESLVLAEPECDESEEWEFVDLWELEQQRRMGSRLHDGLDPERDTELDLGLTFPACLPVKRIDFLYLRVASGSTPATALPSSAATDSGAIRESLAQNHPLASAGLRSPCVKLLSQGAYRKRTVATLKSTRVVGKEPSADTG